MRPNLLAWQWSLYTDGHQRRANLLLHAVTVPLFLLGTVLVVASPFRPLLAAIGIPPMLVSLIAQGAGHKREPTRPVPFDGPGDFVTRFFVEQWVTFPRFVFSGAFARAWRNAAP